MNEIVLKTEDLCKSYPFGKSSVQALSNVNLQVRSGEFVAVIGPSGSGKTTLLNVLGCIDKPTSGSVILDGVNVEKMPESDLYKIRRDKIGFVFQTYNLLPYLNARENVEMPMENFAVSKEARRRRASELLEMVGLSGREEHRPQRLSAGEQQRVAVARALANDPAIILADEPTGNLDTKNSRALVKLLADLSSNQGTTTVMVTHDMAMACLTERVLLLNDGQILKERKGLYSSGEEQICIYCGGKTRPNDVDSFGGLF
ncbi:MAG: ABC transporter ATP-binding protein [Candidatus Bathyarchaeota archaeon]|nr:ABC transporter ATP-binding protein [Candidatus Bathyarchaeota archaeon]